MGVKLVSGIHLEDIHFTEGELAEAPVAHVIEQGERAFAEARGGHVSGHLLPANANEGVVKKVVVVAILVGVELGALGAGVSCIDEALFAAHHVEQGLGIADSVDGAVARHFLAF